MTDVTLGASDLWQGTRKGAGGTATLTRSFFGRNPWLHGQQEAVSGSAVCRANNEFELNVGEINDNEHPVDMLYQWRVLMIKFHFL